MRTNQSLEQAAAPVDINTIIPDEFSLDRMEVLSEFKHFGIGWLDREHIVDSAEKAITDASAVLARYFQMTVNANISTTMIDDKTKVIDEVQVKSDVELFGMQFTNAYYLKKEKKWYAVAYIKRSDAWIQYKPRIDQSSKSFAELYEKIGKEQDSFAKMELCRNAKIQGSEFLRQLEYGRIIAPEKEAAYKADRDKIASIPVLSADAKEKCIIYIEISSDYNNLLRSSISSAFSRAGMKVTKNKEQSNYICSVLVEDNVSSSEPLSINPSLSIKMADKSDKPVYSYEFTFDGRTVSYTLDNARKKCYPKFAETVDKSLSENLHKILNI